MLKAGGNCNSLTFFKRNKPEGWNCTHLSPKVYTLVPYLQRTSKPRVCYSPTVCPLKCKVSGHGGAHAVWSLTAPTQLRLPCCIKLKMHESFQKRSHLNQRIQEVETSFRSSFKKKTCAWKRAREQRRRIGMLRQSEAFEGWIVSAVWRQASRGGRSGDNCTREWTRQVSQCE